MIELLARAAGYGNRTAIVAPGKTASYSTLVTAAQSVAGQLLAGKPSLDGGRVAIMIPPGFEYVAVLWGVWIAGGIAVPLALTHPDPELDYVIDDAAAAVVVGSEELHSRLATIVAGRHCELRRSDRLVSGPSGEPAVPDAADAMLLYTSGTTGRAKGVVWRHAAIAAQAATLSKAWGWSADDRALLVLPLHHVHGLINVVTTALWNGATVEMLPGFDVATTWERLSSGEPTVFMAVPTIYRRLLDWRNQLSATERAAARETMSSMRLMVSGSAALPVATLEAWREASGHTLLERYGMTEIGMALSNSYDGDRIPGAVGSPLPGVEARIVDDADRPVAAGVPGRLQVRGPSVFERYWRRPEETRESFIDGWFRTGDVAVVEGGVYRIRGRESVDIIKTGGEKVSALEIEEVLRAHPAIVDCAVVGIEDVEWGERVAAAITTRGEQPTLDEIRAFCGDRLAPAKIPRTLLVVRDLPRNALGKVIKPEVKELFR